jgi:hypothetical protein
MTAKREGPTLSAAAGTAPAFGPRQHTKLPGRSGEDQCRNTLIANRRIVALTRILGPGNPTTDMYNAK